MSRIDLFLTRLFNGHYNYHLFVIAMLILLLCCSCSTQRQSTVDYIHTYDTIRVQDLRCDTLFLKDSVFIWQKGDTVIQKQKTTEYRVKLQYRDSIRVVNDTIYQKVDVVKEKPYIPDWYKSLSAITIVLALMIGLVLGYRAK